MSKRHELIQGLSFMVEDISTEDKNAVSYGSGTLNVYATPAMIALMEKASLLCVEEFMNDDETTVGGAVNIKHLKPTAIGQRIACKSVIKEVSGSKIDFEVEVHEGDKLIGIGSHTRFIINKTSFMDNL